jgi:hypothetical protein
MLEQLKTYGVDEPRMLAIIKFLFQYIRARREDNPGMTLKAIEEELLTGQKKNDDIN